MIFVFLEELFLDPLISEILINSFSNILYEKNGVLIESPLTFSSPHNYHLYIHHLLKEAHANLDAEHPICSFQLHQRRYQILHPSLTKKDFCISIRKYRFDQIPLNAFLQTPLAQNLVHDLLKKRENFLVIGTTGSGKTTFLNGCLATLPEAERVLILEDTPELRCPNISSLNLYTRITDGSSLQSIDLSRLIKESLRLRPDRIVVGEVRGSEAKDLLLALSTGHRGSFGSLHAANAKEALMRLEMLIQLGAPQWSLRTIRRMIFFGLQTILTVQKDSDGSRKILQISRITSLEPTGFLLQDLLS